MAAKTKAGTCFALPLEIEDSDFDRIEAIEFVFKQNENGEALKTAYFSRDGACKSCMKGEGEHEILVEITREESYLFRQDEEYIMDCRIHYEDSDYNPYTKPVKFFMDKTCFRRGEEVSGT